MRSTERCRRRSIFKLLVFGIFVPLLTSSLRSWSESLGRKDAELNTTFEQTLGVL